MILQARPPLLGAAGFLFMSSFFQNQKNLCKKF